MFVKWDPCFEVGFRYFDFPQQMKFNDFQKQTYNLTFEDPEIVYLGCYSDDDGDGDEDHHHHHNNQFACEREKWPQESGPAAKSGTGLT